MHEFPTHRVTETEAAGNKRTFRIEFPVDKSLGLAELACLYCPLALECSRVVSSGVRFDPTTVNVNLPQQVDISTAVCDIHKFAPQSN
jgi:hypothetical protein